MMTAKRRTTKEPALPPTSPLAPLVEQLRSYALAYRGTTSDEGEDFAAGKIEGLDCAIAMITRFAASKHPEKLDAAAAAGLSPLEVAHTGFELAGSPSLEERVRRLEEEARGRLVPRKPPAVLKLIATPRPTTGAKGARALLVAIAEAGQLGATHAKLGVETGYKATSRRTYLGELTRDGYAVKSGERFVATAKGIAWLGKDYRAPKFGKELRGHTLAVISQGEATILETLIARFPEIVSREELEAATGYKATSIRTYAGQLRAREVISSAREGFSVSPRLFDEDERLARRAR